MSFVVSYSKRGVRFPDSILGIHTLYLQSWHESNKGVPEEMEMETVVPPCRDEGFDFIEFATLEIENVSDRSGNASLTIP